MTTTEELQKQINELLSQINSLQKQFGFPVSSGLGIDTEKELLEKKAEFLSNELEKIGEILSNLTAGTGILLTIAGILSFLPQFMINNGEYLANFLFWTFWLLPLSIITYYPSSLRISSIIKGQPFASTGSSMELEILKNRAQYLELIWKRSVENHDSVIFWNRLTKSFIYTYIVSLVLNFYVFVFYGKPSLLVSIVLLFISCLTATMLLVSQKAKSEKNRVIGDTKIDINAVGGAPSDT
ncbi:MAG: hypothetical protein WCW46_01655 [Candidatus Paceibacterota bacterium]|jgi:hypothetical protein